MSESLHYHRILLVRARPGTQASREALERAEDWLGAGSRRLLAFFHGAGVEHARDDSPSAHWRRLSDWHGIDLAVCSGSWARRHDARVQAPFSLSSLVRFWHHAIEAERVASFGDWCDG